MRRVRRILRVARRVRALTESCLAGWQRTRARCWLGCVAGANLFEQRGLLASIAGHRAQPDASLPAAELCRPFIPHLLRSNCVTTTIALLRAVFNASDAQAGAAAQCAAAAGADACAAAGALVTLDQSVVDGAAAGNFSYLMQHTAQELAGNDSGLLLNATAPKTGAAGAARSGGAAAIGVALLALLLV